MPPGLCDGSSMCPVFTPYRISVSSRKRWAYALPNFCFLLLIPGASQGCRDTNCVLFFYTRPTANFCFRAAARVQRWAALGATGSSLAGQFGSSSLATVLRLRVRILTLSRLREPVLWLLSTASRGRLEPAWKRCIRRRTTNRRDRRATRMGWAPGTDAQAPMLSTVDRTGGNGSPLAGSTDSGGPLSPSDPAVGPAGRS